MTGNDLHEEPPEDLPVPVAAESRSAPAVERVWISSFLGMQAGSRVEVRSAPGGGSSRTIGGYAAVFGVESRNLGGYQEIVTAPFFNKSRTENWPDVICRYNHDDAFLLGTTRSKTLRLQIDNSGLLYDVDLPETRSDVLESVGRGDIVHSSFAFITTEDQWQYGRDGLPVRMLVSGKLVDVSPVLNPGYPEATVALRSLALAKDADYDEVLKLSKQNDLRRLFIRTEIDGGAPSSSQANPPAPLVEDAAELKAGATEIGESIETLSETERVWGSVELMKMKEKQPQPIED